MKKLLFIILFSYVFAAQAQYTLQKANWENAGYRGSKPTFTQVINVMSYGADNTGASSVNTAFANAVNALNGKPGVIYFPAGTYFFNAPLNINRDSIIIRGAAYDSTRLRFNLNGQVQNLIAVAGPLQTDSSRLSATAVRFSNMISVNSAAAFRADDWIMLTMNDQAYMTSSWAYGSLAQTVQIQSISGNNLTLKSPLRFTFLLTNNPVIHKITPRNNVGFECLGIRRMDSTAGQSSNIVFERAVNCWVNGIESDSANFAHVEVNRSANIEVTNSYFHDAFAYGGNGQGYGVLLQFGSNECKVEANYFRHLRHSMLLQAGANGNVLGYNYSVKPYWTEPNLPDSSAGDIVLHGNWPFMNLAEGNFNRNIVIDDSHGKNGPFNTFLRNRADGFGIFMNFSPATDSVQFIGNEITNMQIGLNFLQGNGHVTYGNNYQGNFVNGSANIPDTTLYLGAGQKPPCASGYDAWPVVGRVNGYNTGTIYARARVRAGKLAACSCVPNLPTAVTSMASEAGWSIYPNPAEAYITIKGSGLPEHAAIWSMEGRLLLDISHPARMVEVSILPPGVYLVRLTGKGLTQTTRLLKR